MSMLGAASGLAQSTCMCACPLCSMVPIHEIPAYVHTSPSSLSSVGLCTIWVPTTHFLINSKSIFHSGPTPGPPTHHAVTQGDHPHTLAHPLCTFSTPLHTLVPHFLGLVTLT